MSATTATLADAGIAVEREGARLWITLPLGSPAKAGVKRAGAHWHPESKRWWIGVTKSAALDAALAKSLPRAIAARKRADDLAATVTRRTRDEIVGAPAKVHVARTDRPTQDVIRALGGFWDADERTWVIHRDDLARVEDTLHRDRPNRTYCRHCYGEISKRTADRNDGYCGGCAQLSQIFYPHGEGS